MCRCTGSWKHWPIIDRPCSAAIFPPYNRLSATCYCPTRTNYEQQEVQFRFFILTDEIPGRKFSDYTRLNSLNFNSILPGTNTRFSPCMVVPLPNLTSVPPHLTTLSSLSLHSPQTSLQTSAMLAFFCLRLVLLCFKGGLCD